MNVEIILETVRKIQTLFQTIHVGGSIGLLLHGIDLKRDLSKSDIDLTDKDHIASNMFIESFEDTEESSNPEDFEYQFRYNYPNDRYIKIDISVFPDRQFDVIERDGFKYRVSKKDDIIFYKKKYAENGVKKHQEDLNAMGIEFTVKENVQLVSDTDDLPF